MRVAFSICGEPCRLVQLVPNAFVVRMSSALDEIGAERRRGVPAAPAEPVPAPRSTPRRRRWPGSRCACGPSSAARGCRPPQLVGLPTGAVVELDRQADDAIDLYVNGTRFATGRLVVVDGTDWAVRIEHVLDYERTQH